MTYPELISYATDGTYRSVMDVAVHAEDSDVRIKTNRHVFPVGNIFRNLAI
jgi:hypothetical protein